MGLHAILGLLLLQNIWVVDEAGGPGANFTDIPPAIAAAADGDILLVGAGTYSHFALIGKGLRILGDGAATTFVANAGANGWQTTISGAPADSPVYLDRLKFDGPQSGPGSRVTVDGATTRVTLADTELFGPHSGSTALGVDAGAEVHVFRSTLQGLSGVSLILGATSGGIGLSVLNGARTHVASSTVIGGSGAPCGPFGGNSGPGAQGASVASTAQAWIADSSVVGGSGASCMSAGFGACALPAPGLVLGPGGAFARVSGDGSSSVTGGFGSGGCGPSATGILSQGGTCVVHSVPVLSGFCAFCTSPPPTLGPGITLNATPLPILRVTGTLMSTGTATLTLSNGPAGTAFLIGLAFAPGYADGGPLFLGEIQLDPVNWFPLFSGSLSPLGDFSVTVPLTGLAPSLVHAPLYLQGIALDPSGAFWRASNATVATIRP